MEMALSSSPHSVGGSAASNMPPGAFEAALHGAQSVPGATPGKAAANQAASLDAPSKDKAADKAALPPPVLTTVDGASLPTASDSAPAQLPSPVVTAGETVALSRIANAGTAAAVTAALNGSATGAAPVTTALLNQVTSGILLNGSLSLPITILPASGTADAGMPTDAPADSFPVPATQIVSGTPSADAIMAVARLVAAAAAQAPDSAWPSGMKDASAAPDSDAALKALEESGIGYGESADVAVLPVADGSGAGTTSQAAGMLATAPDKATAMTAAKLAADAADEVVGKTADNAQDQDALDNQWAKAFVATYNTLVRILTPVWGNPSTGSFGDCSMTPPAPSASAPEAIRSVSSTPTPGDPSDLIAFLLEEQVEEDARQLAEQQAAEQARQEAEAAAAAAQRAMLLQAQLQQLNISGAANVLTLIMQGTTFSQLGGNTGADRGVPQAESNTAREFLNRMVSAPGDAARSLPGLPASRGESGEHTLAP